MNNFHLRLQAHSGAVLYFWLSIVSVVVFILLYIMMIRPEWQKWTAVKESVWALQNKQVQHKLILAKLPAQNRLRQQLEQSHLPLRTQTMLKRPLISHIGEWVVNSGGQIVSLQRQVSENEGVIKAKQWHGVLQTTFQGLIEILGNIDALYPPVGVENLQVMAETTGLKITLTFLEPATEYDNE
ncbi:hypothetical protein [Yersinia ruckeri]|uniref:Membrane protein n=1 Tax=Yersinia ruckeri TaxID=29486 RepID=A0A085U711_YERRU|nr:hypothetical protein [Yersinia ruckeri]AKA38877.1 hypothetical protein UGYR_11050 [Yersinia ruckeri]ARY99524.1 hypothetical protein QMA0440_00142 [Yersinia ruckeri]AUQ41695.1 hypothetical protein NJ56_07085 [Yersinia ruckeri]EKN3345814.1 hypothetical protein [Yersinia ruckeri]EKN3361539.1 hypothetical protein [Yersinia ruckeri]